MLPLATHTNISITLELAHTVKDTSNSIKAYNFVTLANIKQGDIKQILQ